RAVVVAIVVAVIGGILEAPDFLAGLAVHAGQAGLVTMAVKQVQPAATDRGHAVACPGFPVPDHPQALLGPGREDALFRGHAGAQRAQEPWPIAAGFSGRRRWS